MPNSPILDIPLLSTSQAAKEDTINSMVGYLERAMNDVVTIDMLDGNLTLPAVDFVRYMAFRVENVAFGSVLTVPLTKRTYVIDNRGNTEPLQVISGGGSATVSAQAVCLMHSDGTSVTIISNSAWTGVDGLLPGLKPNGEHAYWRFVFKSVTGDGNYAEVSEMTFRSSPTGPQLMTGGTAIQSGGSSSLLALDGNTGTKWTSASGTVSTSDHWLGYQFASPVAVTHVDITEGTNLTDTQPLSGTVEFSDDGVTWYEAWSINGWTWTNGVESTNSSTHPLYQKIYANLIDLEDVDVPATPTDGQALIWSGTLQRWVAGQASPHAHRYWRVYVTESNNVNYCAIREIEFRGQAGVPETATGGTASDGGNDGFQPASHAFDGTTNHSILVPSSDNFLAYDFGSPKVVVEAMIQCNDSPSLAPKTFSVEWSDDGSTWFSVYDEALKDDWTNGEEYIATLSFGSADALPAGGTAGQVLTKNSSVDGDAGWQDPASGGSSSELAINDQVASYTLVLTDAGKYVRLANASANNLTVPANASVAFPVGTVITLRQVGAGQMTVVEDTGVTINTSETLKLRKQGSSATLIKVATDEWDLTGDLEVAP